MSKKGEGEKVRNAAIRSGLFAFNTCMPTTFLVTELCQLSIRSPIRSWHSLFTWLTLCRNLLCLTPSANKPIEILQALASAEMNKRGSLLQAS